MLADSIYLFDFVYDIDLERTGGREGEIWEDARHKNEQLNDEIV